MHCFLHDVAVMLVQRPLGKNYPMAWHPGGGGGGRLPWWLNVDAATSTSRWVGCNSSKCVSATPLYTYLGWAAMRYSDDNTKKAERWQQDTCPFVGGRIEGSRESLLWFVVSCTTITGVRLMWWRSANPPICVGSLSTTLRRRPPVSYGGARARYAQGGCVQVVPCGLPCHPLPRM